MLWRKTGTEGDSGEVSVSVSFGEFSAKRKGDDVIKFGRIGDGVVTSSDMGSS